MYVELKPLGKGKPTSISMYYLIWFSNSRILVYITYCISLFTFQLELRIPFELYVLQIALAPYQLSFCH